MEHLSDRLTALENMVRELQHRQRRWRGIAGGLAMLCLLLLMTPSGRAQNDLQKEVDKLKEQIARMDEKCFEINWRFLPLEEKLARVTVEPSVDGNRLVIDGIDLVVRRANVHVQNGLGATNGNPGDPYNPNAFKTNGKGNLIIGYNVERDNEDDPRTGSHCLILGDRNNYTSYGGLIVGDANSLEGAYASVSGGRSNRAVGWYSSVSGGGSNTTDGDRCWIGGGDLNIAGQVRHDGNDGSLASVCGGQMNHALGERRTITGGFDNGLFTKKSADPGGWLGGQKGNRQ